MALTNLRYDGALREVRQGIAPRLAQLHFVQHLLDIAGQRTHHLLRVFRQSSRLHTQR